MLLMEKTFFLNCNLSFTIRVFTLDSFMQKNMKYLQSMSFSFDLRNNTISNLRRQSQYKSITIRLTT